MYLISFDPSLTRTGWAVFNDDILVKYGAITHKRSASLCEKLQGIHNRVCQLTDSYTPDAVLVESSSGHVAGRHKGLNKANGRGLARYGMAVGVVIMASVNRCGKEKTYLIDENTWTRRIPKEARQLVIVASYSSYNKEEDSGCDIADAIGLRDWWVQERKLDKSKHDW